MINFASRSRRSENILYACGWLIVVVLYMLDAMARRADMRLALVDSRIFCDMAMHLLPFVVLFMVNNYVLIPRFLFRNRLGTYLLLAFALMMGADILAYLEFRGH